MKFSSLVGSVFGSLVVVAEEGRDKRGGRLWRCQCACGLARTVVTGHLTSGQATRCSTCSQSRGVGAKGGPGRPSAKRGTHGLSSAFPRAYAAWVRMIKRCEGRTTDNLRLYASRGITVCQEWATSFETFVRSMGEPAFGLSLDRINNNGPYAPWNCRWATAQEQSVNRRTVAQVRVDQERHAFVAGARYV